MARLISYNNSKIQFISDTSASSSLKSKNSFVLDPSFDAFSNDELMENYVVWNERLLHKDDRVNCKDLKVAFISNYRSECGISTYSEKLYKAIVPYVKEYRIFAEDTGVNPVEDNVVPCWTRNKSISKLLTLIHEYKPDVILIQHEYGLWSDVKIWLSLLTQLNQYKVFVVLHSVYEFHDDKTVCELAIKNIIVHTDIAYKALKRKGIPNNIFRIAHGCDPVNPNKKPWNMYRSEHTFMQFGFGFRYKGWENSIRVAGKLKEKYPDVFFTGVFSESPFNVDLHQNYFESLMTLVKELGLEENVGFIRGFVPEDLLIKVMMMNRVALFPYIDNGVHTVMGCSGAARTALTAKLPVVVTDVPLFDDLEGICPRCKSIDEIAESISKFWGNSKTYQSQVKKQNTFIEQNSWDVVAKQMLDLFGKAT